MYMYVAKYISHVNNTTRISFVYKYGPYETDVSSQFMHGVTHTCICL